MLEDFYTLTKYVSLMRTGPSAPHLDGFSEALSVKGYSARTGAYYLRTAVHLGHFVHRRRTDLAALVPATLDSFFRHLPRCRCPVSNGTTIIDYTRAGARRFYEYLIDRGVCEPVPIREVESPEIVVGYGHWLQQHCGVAELTLAQHIRYASNIVEVLGPSPSEWDARRVRNFVLDCVRLRGTPTASKIVSVARKLLRYLSFQGACPSDLYQAVPTVANWRLAALPRCLTTEEVNRLIAVYDGDSVRSLRARAIILMLARLGLRAGDVAQLRLDDIEWQTGTLRVRGKGRFEVRLPLPQEVGDAVLRYLECRPRICHSDFVFLSSVAPFKPFVSRDSISYVVRQAIKLSGVAIPAKGAHFLRHTAATEMLRQGVRLDQIGLVLRHRSIQMTAYYAKADVSLLKQVSQPWPGVRP